VSGRRSHDAARFYAGFDPPAGEGADDEDIGACGAAGRLFCGDSADMAAVADNSVALVVTSPPVSRRQGV